MAPRYVALSKVDNEGHDDFEADWDHASRRGRSYFWVFSIIGHVLILSLYSLLFFLRISPSPNTKACTTQLSSWSPALPAVEYQTQYFQGTFSGTNEYKGIPTEEIDQAWNRISLRVPALRLREEDFAAMGKSPTERNWHQIPEEFGGGYLGMTEVFHLLHCLDEIRKLTFPDHYPELWAKRDSPGTRVHTDHCLDIIRQRIMCTGDVGPVPFYDSPYHAIPMPDFSTRHQCRNFEKLLDWGYHNERAIDWDQMGDLNTSHSHFRV